jgi:hypothetical protein
MEAKHYCDRNSSGVSWTRTRRGPSSPYRLNSGTCSTQLGHSIVSIISDQQLWCDGNGGGRNLLSVFSEEMKATRIASTQDNKRGESERFRMFWLLHPGIRPFIPGF